MDKLIGKEPEIFEGDQNKVKEFMTGWSVYQGLNKYTCYVTVGTFTRRGLSSTAKTLRSLSGVRGSEY